ncbi:hypothetical protein NEFER03_0297 [Nematocida sp. LUAm3]|nr:hypothetical protein NEFER03_0297 [Nematocida sp. LUAm3]KAI5173749.1 hypothetical protein NEFER02_0265 [Nematocida sp. LUAm2]KAI5176972.1 hypothetical protein NEFER01_0297 [Nematocida sp. LUAm1]
MEEKRDIIEGMYKKIEQELSVIEGEIQANAERMPERIFQKLKTYANNLMVSYISAVFGKNEIDAESNAWFENEKMKESMIEDMQEREMYIRIKKIICKNFALYVNAPNTHFEAQALASMHHDNESDLYYSDEYSN